MKILEIYRKKLRFKNYSERTIEIYVCYLEKFFIETKCKDPYHISLSQIKIFLENKKYTSTSQQNQYIGSIKLFAKYFLNKKDIHLRKIERPKKRKKLPRVIDSYDVLSKILSIKNTKHRLILMIGLSCGLRISEVINLKRKDIDIKRMVIHINKAKGNKDRVVKLTNNVLDLIMEYGFEYRPVEYLFNGQNNSKQYSTSSIQNLIKKYIDPNESYHLLRNVYATFAIDNGTELKPLSVSMGHNSTKTVERFYFHQSQRTLKTIRQAI